MRRWQRWGGALAVGLAMVCWDVHRTPGNQSLGIVYVWFVKAYQNLKRPLGLPPICRFQPSCSDYSRVAVEKHGLIGGLQLTCSRLCRCRTGIPFGTPDPVPAASSVTAGSPHPHPDSR